MSCLCFFLGLTIRGLDEQADSLACIEGSWNDVMNIIGQAHSLLHTQGIVRIQSDIRVGSRTDKSQTMEDKVSAVNKILGKDA